MTVHCWSPFHCNGLSSWPITRPAPISSSSSSPTSAAEIRMCCGRPTRRAATAATSVNRARRRGVVVVPRARLEDFGRCVEQFQVVTLVAHWRSAMFRANEILNPDAVGRVLSIPLPGGGRGRAAAAEMAVALNRHLLATVGPSEPTALDGGRDAAVETRRQYALWHERREIEPLLGSAVRSGGPAVEFADGLAPIERVVSSIPETFDGVLDLTVCNSTVLAEEVRRRCRRGLIVANAFPATLDIRMEFYNAAIDLVQRHHVSYQDAIFGVRQMVRRES
jgi:hypothetical protein